MDCICFFTFYLLLFESLVDVFYLFVWFVALSSSKYAAFPTGLSSSGFPGMPEPPAINYGASGSGGESSSPFQGFATSIDDKIQALKMKAIKDLGSAQKKLKMSGSTPPTDTATGAAPHPNIQAILQPPNEFTLIAGRMNTPSKSFTLSLSVLERSSQSKSLHNIFLTARCFLSACNVLYTNSRSCTPANESVLWEGNSAKKIVLYK